MNTIDYDALIDRYLAWLKEKMCVQDVDGTCEITTPFLDRHNDSLQIYVKPVDAGLLLTDDGHVLRDLQLSGLEFNSERRKKELQAILNGFGVQQIGDELTVEASEEDFGRKKHNMVQAMLSVGDLASIAPAVVASLFREDVENFLRGHHIRFTPTVTFKGKSGFDHQFDFVIPESETRPERILRAITRPSRQSVTALIFSWSDTREVRPEKATAYAVLNDTDTELSHDVVGALSRYSVRPVPWSQRERYVEELAS
jgi:hypothetical protein